MKDRHDMIGELTEALGNEATRADGEVVFDYLRKAGEIVFNPRDGYVLNGDVDVFGALVLANWNHDRA